MDSSSKITALITARKDSQRVPFKNRETVGGIPLWMRSVLFAQSCGLHPVVDTDDELIIEACKYRGFEVHKRTVPSEKEGGTHWQAIEAAAEDLGINMYVLLQPTSPFRCQQVLKDCLNSFDGSGPVLTYSTEGKWDGNIAVHTYPKSAWYEPTWVRNYFACSLQIDFQDDLIEARAVSEAWDGLFRLDR